MVDYLDKITVLAKLTTFPSHLQAARLASIVCYYYGDSERALEYALLSKQLFDVAADDKYTRKIVSFAFQKYIQNMQKNIPISEDHQVLVQRCIENLLKNKKYSQVLTLSIETHMKESIKIALEQCPSLASGAITLCQETGMNNEYKKEILDILVDFSRSRSDKFQLSQLYLHLQDYISGANLLKQLCTSSKTDDKLMGYQIAFELAENAHQKYRAQVIDNLPPELNIVKDILTRKLLLQKYLDFLFQKNKNDIHVLISLKDSLDTARSIIHTSVTIAYSYMYAGVGDDNFFRVNLNWFITTRKWAQFTTAAAVGAIHVGHLEDALKVLTSFLVKEAPEHVTGGAIYALGLIYVNYRWDKAILNIVTEKLESSSQKTSYDQTNKPLYVIQHGACLALGLISLGSRDTSHYNLLLKVIREDHPEPGEAAGYALGMVMLGSGSQETIDEMIRICENTEHEKIMRGIAMGLGFVLYGCGARANDTIQRMLDSRQPLMREGAAWIIALANIGNASNDALQKLLHIAVSDVNDNVRRAAVIGIGFVLSRRPKEVPSMINLLAQSYHAHVRAGAALAIGISCAGTGNSEAIEVLKPLLNDNEDAVTQNAMIAMAMVLMQQSDARVPYVKEFRTFLRQMTSRRRQEMLIFGTCCAWGILNAGGRNVVISCNSLRGENSVSATVGLAMFCNHFFWHPLALMLPLSFHPTSIIGLDENLNVVNWRMRCNAPKADFDYPPDFQEESKKQMAMPVKLSISGQQTQQQQQFFDESDSDKSDEKSDEEGDKNCQIIENMSRVTLSQLPYIDIEYEKSYTPIIGHVTHGFIMLKKNTK